MKIIGITGKSGSGKTTFASLLSKKLECNHIDIDKIGHQALLQPEIIYKICNTFGNEILDEKAEIDRKKLGNIVFSQKQKMEQLSNITWSYMEKALDNILSQHNDIIVLEWILLPHSKYWEKCNCKILVTSNDTKRKNKIIERDHITEEYFNKRDSASIEHTSFKFDYILENDYNLETIDKLIEKII